MVSFACNFTFQIEISARIFYCIIIKLPGKETHPQIYISKYSSGLAKLSRLYDRKNTVDIEWSLSHLHFSGSKPFKSIMIAFFPSLQGSSLKFLEWNFTGRCLEKDVQTCRSISVFTWAVSWNITFPNTHKLLLSICAFKLISFNYILRCLRMVLFRCSFCLSR